MRESSTGKVVGDILIVDDHPENLEFLESILEKEGHRVRAATNGKLALQSVLARPPDLVLLDIVMPEMDGLETCQRLKENPDTSHIPIIFISALNEIKDQVLGFEMGGVDFITKPFEKKIVLRRIKTQVALADARQQIKQERDLLEIKVQQRTKELVEQEKLLRIMAENYPHSYVSIVEKDLTIGVTGGQEFRKQNLDPGSFVGLKLEDVFGRHTNTVREHYLKAFQGEEISFELFINKQWQSYEVVPLFDENGDVHRILAVVENITKRKQQEEELAKYRDHLEKLVKVRTKALTESEANLKEAQQIAGIGRWELNLLDNNLDWSDTIFEIFEIDSKEYSPSYEGFLKAIHPEDRAIVDRAYTDSIDNKTPYEIEHRLKMKDGRIKWVHETCQTFYDPQGKPLRSVGVVQDVTWRKQAEDKLKRAVERLKELDQLKSMFIASMSHELRTPLNSIIGFTGLLLQGISGDITELQRENLNRVSRAGKHLLSLITDVIDISKIEAGRVDVYPKKFSLGEVVTEAADSIQSALNNKNMSLVIEVSNWPEVNTDRKLLLQCLLNCISNAVKYSEQGKVIIAVKESGDWITIDIQDTGIGIAVEDIPLLFEAFERLPNKLKVKAGGTGLGLYLTKKIVTTLLQGEISVKSTLGEGSTFSLSFPRELVSDDQQKQEVFQ